MLLRRTHFKPTCEVQFSTKHSQLHKLDMLSPEFREARFWPTEGWLILSPLQGSLLPLQNRSGWFVGLSTVKLHLLSCLASLDSPRQMNLSSAPSPCMCGLLKFAKLRDTLWCCFTDSFRPTKWLYTECFSQATKAIWPLLNKNLIFDMTSPVTWLQII